MALESGQRAGGNKGSRAPMLGRGQGHVCACVARDVCVGRGPQAPAGRRGRGPSLVAQERRETLPLRGLSSCPSERPAAWGPQRAHSPGCRPSVHLPLWLVRPQDHLVDGTRRV